MDYTKVPRILIYKERSTLEDFGVYEPKSFNAALYEALMSLNDLKPRYEGVFGEILRLFNDAYYYLTQIFLEKNPLERYARYCDEAGAFPPDHDFDWDSESREMVVKCMIFVMLRTFGKNLPAPQQRLLTAMAADIYESNSYQDMGTALRRLRGEEEDIAYKITCNFEFNIMPGSISQQDYTRRDIQELLDSDVSLKECLSAGKVLREAVNILCKDKKQKLALIDRLLEPEKDGYGSLDIRITESYRSLYELRSELTGEPLPEKLPFERFADALGPPMVPQYSQDIIKANSDNESVNPQAMIDLQNRIEELEEQVTHYHNMEKGIALGLNQGQSSLLVKSMAKTFGFTYTNMKTDLAPLAHGLFGWGESKLAKYMSTPCEKEERNELANLFKNVCPKLYSTIMNWGELPPEETPT